MVVSMSFNDPLDPESIETFEAEGAVAIRGLIDGPWVESLRSCVPEILGRTYDSAERIEVLPDTKVQSCDGMWREYEPFARFLFRSPVGAVAATFMRSQEARLYEDLLLYKAAGEPAGTSWHRDAPHWPLSGRQMCSIWLSLDSVRGDTGCMRFVAGSHLDGEDMIDPRSIDLKEQDLEGRRVLSIETDPGDVIIFHPRAAHMVHSPVLDRPRRTFTLRFLGDDVRWRPRRAVYHQWMGDCGLQKDDRIDHPWFPVLGRSAG
jgi:ectoine hydroxylase-related dioxygenase (phytanoyl-CoA dioxygenase family)